MEMILKLKRGWLEIPKEFQDKLHLKENDEIVLTAEHDYLMVKTIPRTDPTPPLEEKEPGVEIPEDQFVDDFVLTPKKTSRITVKVRNSIRAKPILFKDEWSPFFQE
jgi:bifunctional DNA-binding transcriptional regulator/antitoxin component of YhaV-PrlF toxin-antitoxin module